MNSMTGFGQSSSSSEQVDLEISIKAVNGRFLDTRLHIPKEYAPLEASLRKELKRVFHRGTLDIYVHRRPHESAISSNLEVNWSVADQLYKICNEMRKKYKSVGEIDLNAFVRNSDIIRVEEKVVVRPAEKKQLIETLKTAIEKMDGERRREGASLKKVLDSLLKTLGGHHTSIKKMRVEAKRDIEKRYDEKMSALAEKYQVDRDRFVQEAAILVDKTDIAEEISRLGEHIRAFKEESNSKGPIGKKLDFYTQEFLREINTIGSKAQNTGLTRLVVEAKSVVEKIREQVQNIE